MVIMIHSNYQLLSLIAIEYLETQIHTHNNFLILSEVTAGTDKTIPCLMKSIITGRSPFTCFGIHDWWPLVVCCRQQRATLLSCHQKCVWIHYVGDIITQLTFSFNSIGFYYQSE